MNMLDKLTDEMFALLDRTRLADAWAAFEASGGNPKKYCAPPLPHCPPRLTNEPELPKVLSSCA